MFIPPACKENLASPQFGPALLPVHVEILRCGEFYRTFRWFQVCPPGTIEWKTFELLIAGLPPSLNGLRLVQLSDFHFRQAWSSVYEQVLARINGDPPDLLLLTGDFVDHKRNPYPALPCVRRLLSGLRRDLARFAIVGNHDDYAVPYELRDLGITFLNGKRVVHETKGASIELIGLPGVHRLELEGAFLRRLPPRSAGVPRIVLSHFPDHCMRLGSLQPDVILSGHTHGGQMCLPGGIPIIWHDGVPRRAARGVRKVNDAWLVVSRGLGTTGLPFRVFCPPEVVELKLKKEVVKRA